MDENNDFEKRLYALEKLFELRCKDFESINNTQWKEINYIRGNMSVQVQAFNDRVEKSVRELRGDIWKSISLAISLTAIIIGLITHLIK